MNKLTKKIGLLMLVLVLALCPAMMFTGCKKDTATPAEILAEAKTEFDKILSLYSLQMYDSTDARVPPSQLPSYSSVVFGKEEAIVSWGCQGYDAGRMTEVFVNEDGNLQYCVNDWFDGCQECRYIVENDADGTGYFTYNNYGDEYEKTLTYIKSDYENFDTGLGGVIGMFLDEIWTVDYKSASKTGSVYSITATMKNFWFTEPFTATIEFNAELKQITYFKQVQEQTAEEGVLVRYTLEYTFDYNNPTFTVPQEVRDASLKG